METRKIKEVMSQIDKAIIYRTRDGQAWTVWFYGDFSAHIESPWKSAGKTRTFQALDAAYKAIKGVGFSHKPIEISD